MEKFWRATKANRLFEHDAYMTDIWAVGQEAFTYIDSIGRQRLSDVYVDGHRYNMLISNATECTNGLLKESPTYYKTGRGKTGQANEILQEASS